MQCMRTGRLAGAAGAVALAMGIVFHLQGVSVVGPESSFMYSSPQWAGWGLWIAAAGATVVLVAWVRAAGGAR